MATQMPDPPLLRLESESYHTYLALLQRLPREKPALAKDVDVELRLVRLCEEVLKVSPAKLLPFPLLFFALSAAPLWVLLPPEETKGAARNKKKQKKKVMEKE